MAASASSGGAGKANVGDLTFTKTYDRCSQRFISLGLTQQHIPRVLITELDKNNLPVLLLLLEDVVFSGVQLQQPPNEGTSQEVTLAYAKMTITDASGGGSVVVIR